MKIRIADIINDSIVDGPGLRLTVFTQGCIHNCKGCHNPATHDIDGGRDIEIDEIMDMVDQNCLLSGVTLSGGDPFLQVEGMTELSERVVEKGLNVIAYTGFTWEKLMENKEKYLGLLKYVDYLIDGPFIEDLKSYELQFRGSSNQRIIDVKKSLENNSVIEHTF